MLSLFLAATLCVAPERIDTFDSAQSAAEALADDMQTGTLLFTSGDCLAIRVATASRMTHVGAVVIQNGVPMVYESTNKVGVRCVTLQEYLAYQSSDAFYVYQPREPFSDTCAAAFQEHLDAELGRPYSVLHHLTGGRADGVHCAEYVTEALMAADCMHVARPSRVSPAELAERIVESGLYEPAQTVAILEPVPQPVTGKNWCARMWIGSKRCTLECCNQLMRWFCCK